MNPFAQAWAIDAAYREHQNQVRFQTTENYLPIVREAWGEPMSSAERLNSTFPSSETIQQGYIDGELEIEDFEELLGMALALEDPDDLS